jgi:glyoxylate reductase
MSQTEVTRHISDRRATVPLSADGTVRKLLVTGSGIDVSRLPLDRLGLELTQPSHVLTEEQLIHELTDVVAYLHGGEERASEAALRKANKLRVVAFLGVGYESFVDVAAAEELHIAVTNTPGAARDSVATFTVGQIINANWRITQQLGNRYPDWSSVDELPHELNTRKIGIVGMGTIGGRIAELLDVFGAKLAYFSRTRKESLEERYDMTFMPLQDLAEWSDILVVMVPGNEKTKSMIDDGVLARVRPGTILINTARPAVVDPAALHTAMKDDRISLAVFDGFYGKDCDAAAALLTDFGDRLMVTGHIASHTHEAMNRMVDEAVKSIENILNGESDPHSVWGTGRIPKV